MLPFVSRLYQQPRTVVFRASVRAITVQNTVRAVTVRSFNSCCTQDTKRSVVTALPSPFAPKNSYSLQTMSSVASIKYLNQDEAVSIDEELFNDYKFSVDQLMELAGQGCAHALAQKYPVTSHPRVLVICGPGNNGGDGLVCGRHLMLLGYAPALHCVKRTDKPLYNNLYDQCTLSGVQMLDRMPTNQQLNTDYDVIVDAIFGFSFKPPVRPAFVPVIESLAQSKLPVLSVDIPSGWDIVSGPPSTSGTSSCLSPDTLVSLTAPKLCARHFKGRHHILAGRFVPGALCDKYKLNLPLYPGTSLTVDL